jgi:sporulation integral membrane protein YtvI
MQTFRKYLRITLNIIIPLAVILLIALLGPRLLGFFMPFIIGWVIAMIANPLVHFLEKRLKIVRKASSLAIVVGVLAVIVLGGYYLISNVVMQCVEFIRDLPNLFEQIETELDYMLMRFSGLFAMLPLSVQEALQNMGTKINDYASSLVSHFGDPAIEVAGNVAKGIPGALVYTVVTIMSSYFFIADREKVLDFLRKYMPGSIQRYMRMASSNTKRLVGGYFLAQFRIMFVVAVLLVVGFWILHIKYSVLLAILIAFLDFLPVFGTGTVLIPWALLKFFNGEYYLAIGLGVLYVVTQVTRQLIQPKIVGDSMGLNPMATLFLLYVGFRVGGLGGMILAVPVGLIVIEFYKFGAFDSLMGAIKELITEVNSFRFSKDQSAKDTGGRADEE